MSSPAFLLQKLSPGKCPENGLSFASLGEALAFSCMVAVTYTPLQSASAIFCLCSCSSTRK